MIIAQGMRTSQKKLNVNHIPPIGLLFDNKLAPEMIPLERKKRNQTQREERF